MRMKKSSSKPSIPAAVRRHFQHDLLEWFENNRRDLPWRRNRTPYRVWMSELMLQQTRVDQAIPYYHRFMKLFPSLSALAAAPEMDVLKAWEGLGYYQRARRAHATAKDLVKNYGGTFPATYEGLIALPGIGPYTAAAIASLAFGLDHAVLDGNVYRVLARVFAVNQSTDLTSVRRQFEQMLAELLPAGRAAQFNEGIMELGAMVCTPAQPRCDQCPLAASCQARKLGRVDHYPVRSPGKKVPHRHVGAGVIVDDRGRILIARRLEKSMLGGLWEFPGGGVEKGETRAGCIKRELKEELGIDVRVGPALITVRHAFSHFTMDLHAYWVRVDRGRPKAIHCAGWKWVTLDEIDAYPLPRADQKILAAIRRVTSWPEF